MSIKRLVSTRVKTSLAVVTATVLALVAACTSPTSDAMGGCAPGTSQGQSVAGLSQVTLCIASGKTVRSFTVEVAASTPEQAQGLMYRTSLADNAGMIFPFAQPRVASFWMQNTVIPLDIIFVRTDGTIESIAADTIPYSTDPVVSGETVGAVLELRGGLTDELGIKAGDKVVWK